MSEPAPMRATRPMVNPSLDWAMIWLAIDHEVQHAVGLRRGGSPPPKLDPAQADEAQQVPPLRIAPSVEERPVAARRDEAGSKPRYGWFQIRRG